MSGSDSDHDRLERLFAELATLETDAERQTFFEAEPHLRTADFVGRLCDRVNRALREDMETARNLLATAGWLADVSEDKAAQGRFLRTSANALVVERDFRRAAREYEAALELFREVGDRRETVRTLSSGLSPLSFTDEYERAQDWAAEARELCQELGDPLPLARLEFNTGQLLARQDRLSEALERYRSAYEVLRVHGEPTDIAVALQNIAVSHMQLDDFEAAIEAYREAGEFCTAHGLTRFGVEVEYNVAYLHFLRGDHERTIRLLEQVRVKCEDLEDDHHKALCDLDLAEIYLELNLNEEAGVLAHRAVTGFDTLGMRYEGAKALTYEAIAASRRGRRGQATELLDRARASFAALDNHFWTALMDVFRSQILTDQGELAEARTLAAAALEAFLEIGVPAKIATCEILLARQAILGGDFAAAEKRSESALARIDGGGVPAVEYQAHLALGLAAERAGKRKAALGAYRRADGVLEGMRSHLRSDELKISFSHGQQSVYEGLVAMLIEGDQEPRTRRQVFHYIQRAKSRGLSELLASRVHEIRPTREMPSSVVAEINQLRAEANWYHRQIDMEESKGAERSLKRIEALSKDGGERERVLLRRLRRLQMSDPELGALQGSAAADLEAVRAVLPENTQLLEYFTARDVVYACLVDARNLGIWKLAPASELAETYSHLRTQIGRFRFGPANIVGSPALAERTTEAYLGRLFDRLIRPLLDDLKGHNLIVAPHGFLHHLPFSAFHDGERFLNEIFSVSYAPSATVFQLCSNREVEAGEGALVMGVPDERAPLILDEVRAVAATLPDSHLLVGEEASVENLSRYGETCRILHIATHGLFHRDNPMFSAVRLGTSRLTLFDLYNLKLRADLVVLSGCSTGLSSVRGADELVGLTRGLLYAGARAVLVTLWDVHDESTSRFMTSFYRRLEASSDPREALRLAQREVRAEYPHPYYWAPFVLVGKC